MSPSALALAWRSRADVIERYAPPVAAALRDCAQELEDAAKADDLDTVGLAEAAVLSGYHPDALGKMVKDGRIENLGKKHRPRIRRRDVPKKPGHRAIDTSTLALAGAR